MRMDGCKPPSLRAVHGFCGSGWLTAMPACELTGKIVKAETAQEQKPRTKDCDVGELREIQQREALRAAGELREIRHVGLACSKRELSREGSSTPLRGSTDHPASRRGGYLLRTRFS